MPRVVSGNGWIVNIDVAVLNDVGIHLTKQGQRIQHAALGSLRPYSERPLCGHAPAMTLDLGADTPHKLLIRVQTSGAMMPPIMQMALQWAPAQASPQCLAAVYLKDLDRFQPVNDTYGHDVGDNLLLAVRHRLRSNVRQHSVLVARLGGDDFIVMAHKLATPEQAHEWRPFSLCASEKSFRLSHLSIQMGLTIGYALADAAMYAGKEIGKHCIGRDPGELALAS